MQLPLPQGRSALRPADKLWAREKARERVGPDGPAVVASDGPEHRQKWRIDVLTWTTGQSVSSRSTVSTGSVSLEPPLPSDAAEATRGRVCAPLAARARSYPRRPDPLAAETSSFACREPPGHGARRCSSCLGAAARSVLQPARVGGQPRRELLPEAIAPIRRLRNHVGAAVVRVVEPCARWRDEDHADEFLVGHGAK
jgi:hypothetical protein